MSMLTTDRSESIGPVPGARRRLNRSAIRKLLYGDGPIAPLSLPVVSAVWTAAALSALAAWFVLYAVVLSGLQQDRNNSVLYPQLREGLSGATTPIGGAIAPGTPIALVSAPVAGLSDVVVVEGTAPTDLRNGPGHRRDTPLPGQAGVSVLFGRSRTYGAPFKHIAAMQKGQSLTVTTGQGSFTYRVIGVRRAGDPLPTPLAAGGSRLMLETSTSTGLSSSNTVFVDAELKGASVAAPPGRLTGIPRNEQAMGNDTSGLIKLVLWAQALLLAMVAVVWAKARWGIGQAWLVGLPLILAVLWGATGNVLMLLPNLF
ncbi:MAG: sortase [Pseudonocardiales bacterium]|nr:sortase [Pseudonocardiales bacterium]